MAKTLSRHLIEQQRKHMHASGRFTELLLVIAVAAKIISHEVNKAGLVEILGFAGKENVFGEKVQKLDIFAERAFKDILSHSGLLCAMSSEESNGIIPIDAEYPAGPYILNFDPLDGSSNIDAKVSIGTIFSVFRKVGERERGSTEDFLQAGVRQVCAGYIIFGSSTMLVYTCGAGVHGFTLDPGIGEFLLSHPNIQFPEQAKSKNNLSVNIGNFKYWDQGTKDYVDRLTRDADKPYTHRYIGSLVADFHRNLLYGGVYLYPASKKDDGPAKAKLRLLYEAAPLAFIAEQAGGMASTGTESIMNIVPKTMEDNVPLIIGSKYDVELYDEMYKKAQGG